MEAEEANKRLGLFFGITSFFGFVFFMLTKNVGVLYILNIVFVLGAFYFEENRKEKIGKYIMTFIFSMAFVYVLFNFI